MKTSLSDIMQMNELEIVWGLRGWSVFQFGILIATRFPSKTQAREYIINKFAEKKGEKK